MAMQGLLCCPVSELSYLQLAENSVRQADALLAELEKEVSDE